MRRLNSLVATAFLVVAVTLTGRTARAEFTTIIDNGPSGNRVDLMILGDGYTAGEIDTTYTAHVDALIQYMFNQVQDPYPRYKNFFNVHRIDVVSNQAGADIPGQGIYVDTALDASYGYGGGPERALYINESKANAAIGQAGAFAAADARLVTVNSTKYGGAASNYGVYAGGNSAGTDVALHELGHAFHNLADEYGGNSGTYTGGEPSAVNLTTSPSGAKWSQWLGYNQPGIGVIGAYEGGGYYDHGIYRPSYNSKMNSLGQPFDAVSREKMILDIYDRVDPLDDWRDTGSALFNPQSLWVDTVDPEVIDVEWYVDGSPVTGATGESFRLQDYDYGPGTYEVTAVARDNTDWVRINLDKLEQTVSWNVELGPAPNLVYYPTSGNVRLYADSFNIVAFNLQSEGQFGSPANFSDLEADTGYPSGPTDSTASDVGWISGGSLFNVGFDGPQGSINTPYANLGDIFPTGLDLDGLEGLLTHNAWAGPGGTGNSFELYIGQEVLPGPDLVYDPTSGAVRIIADDFNILSFNLQSEGEFISPADFSDLNADTGYPSGPTDNTASDIGWVSGGSLFGVGFDGPLGSNNTPFADLGNIFPTGLGLNELAALLTNNAWAGPGGTGSQFELAIDFFFDPADTDKDGDVDTADLTTMFQNFTGAGGLGKTMMQGDTDGDGDVDTADITTGLQNFTGAQDTGLATVPEPSSFVLMGLGLVVVIGAGGRRRAAARRASQAAA